MVEETFEELPGEPPSTAVGMLSLENGTVRLAHGTLRIDALCRTKNARMINEGCAARAHPLAPVDRAGQLRPLRDLGPPAPPPMAFATQGQISRSIRDLTLIMNLMACKTSSPSRFRPLPCLR
jgi:hypothetical protein